MYYKSSLCFIGLLVLFVVGCTASLGIDPNEDVESIEGAGPNDDEQDTPVENSILPCNSVAWCTNFNSSADEYQVESSLGGQITDGIYRLERGSAFADALIFEGNRFLRVFHNSSNTGGTFQITSYDTISFFHDIDCNENVGNRQLGDGVTELSVAHILIAIDVVEKTDRII